MHLAKMSSFANVPSCFLLVITWSTPIDILRCIYQGCHNKVPPTGWLKTIERYWLPVLESSSLKSRCLRAVRNDRLPASLLTSGGLLAISGLPWLVDDCLLVCLHKVFSLCACVCFTGPRFIRTPVRLD